MKVFSVIVYSMAVLIWFTVVLLKVPTCKSRLYTVLAVDVLMNIGYTAYMILAHRMHTVETLMRNTLRIKFLTAVVNIWAIVVYYTLPKDCTGPPYTAIKFLAYSSIATYVIVPLSICITELGIAIENGIIG